MTIDEICDAENPQASDIDARIAELDARFVHMNDEAWEEEYADEYAALRQFKDDVIGQVTEARWTSDLTLIPDFDWDDFADSEARNYYGDEAVDSGFWDENHRFAGSLKQDYRSAHIDNNGTSYEFWFRI